MNIMDHDINTKKKKPGLMILNNMVDKGRFSFNLGYLQLSTNWKFGLASNPCSGGFFINIIYSMKCRQRMG